MVEVIECQSLEERTKEKAGEVFKILEEKGLFVREFSGLFRMFNELFQDRKLRDYQETAWHIEKGRWRWWGDFRFWWGDSNVMDGMIVSLSTNNITFLVSSRSALLSQIRDIAEQIKRRSNFEVKIVRF